MTESRLQQSCVRWFRYEYPRYRSFLIAIPNEGKRSDITGSRMKAEGMVTGASDLILFDPHAFQYPMFLECKTPTGKQQPNQKEFQRDVENGGYIYKIFRTFDEFEKIVNTYLE